MKNNLSNLPKIYYINMDEAVDRNNYMIDMFKKAGITNYERSVGRKATRTRHKLLSTTQYGCVIAHMDAICKVANGPDEYALILEDDINLLVSKYWHFTWKEFIDRVPEFDVLQLFRISRQAMGNNHAEKPNDFEHMIRFKKWEIGDFMAPAYLITKSYAKQIEKSFKKDPIFLSNFASFSRSIGPVADHIIYVNAKAYSASIFTTELFTSQIGDQHNWDPYINLLNLLDKELKQDFTLDKLFTTYESDNGIVQA